MARILLIDDDPDLTYILREDLARHGHQVDCLDSAERGPEMLVDRAFDLVLLDNFMPKMSGIEFLSALQQRGVDVPVILMTQLGSADTAIQAMRFGAYDYVIKPREHQGLFPLLQPIIARALAPTPPLADHPPPEPPPRPSAGPMLVGSKSKSMVAVYMQIGRLARGDTAVLILGETGTGKELVARAIHSHSPRMARRFVALDCTDLSENLLDGELFGHDGTLFLDEIGDLSMPLQAKLLRVLDHQPVTRVGSNEVSEVNVRLLLATRHDLEAAMAAGTFRTDLFYRLKRETIQLPPLRDRLEDIPGLAAYFLAQAADCVKRLAPTLMEAALETLGSYRWPGNVRELENVLYHAVGVCRGSRILPSDLWSPVVCRPTTPGEEEAIAGLQRAIRWAWTNCRTNLYTELHDLLRRELLKHTRTELEGDQGEAARRLGIPPEALRAWIQLLLPQWTSAPDPGAEPPSPSKQDKTKERRARAIILIQDHPEWTVKQYARELGCAPSTLYLDPIISRLLQER